VLAKLPLPKPGREAGAMRQSRQVLLVIAGLSGISHVAARDTCPGSINVDGHGAISLISAMYNVPSDIAPADGMQVVGDYMAPHLKSRTYFAETCSPGLYNNADYAAFKLLGKKLSYEVDLSGAGCGCNVALYLVSMRQNTLKSQCEDFYCDANSVCGVACAEIDIQEANRHAFHATLHSQDDKSGVANGIGGLNGIWSSEDYGPDGRCIDTHRTFSVSAAFPVSTDGSLEAMEIELSQAGKPCKLSERLDSYAVDGEDKMRELSRALAEGMAPVVSYWKSPDMSWLDGEGFVKTGLCDEESMHCGDQVRLGAFYIETMPGPVPMTAPPRTEPPRTEPPWTVPPTTSVQEAEVEPELHLPSDLEDAAWIEGDPQGPAPTTWRPEVGGAHHSASCRYMSDDGKLAPGEFSVDTDGCEGVGECQFRTLAEAQNWCDRHVRCSIIVLHPYRDNCAGGYGCYTPRWGSESFNPLMDRIGGKAWVKDAACTPPSTAKSPYVFIGFHTADQARSACRQHGQLAMPKTAKLLTDLQEAIYATFAAGKMEMKWPKDTVWVGGRWNGVQSRWEWDDGSEITGLTWAPGQPSAAGSQEDEPYLSMLLDGEVHDGHTYQEFGVMCELADAARLLQLPVEELTTSGAPPTTSAAPAPPHEDAGAKVQWGLPAAEPLAQFDCRAGFANWMVGWSVAKKEWCCEHERLGCAGTQAYELVGFAKRELAKDLCPAGTRLAMPRTKADLRVLEAAVASARVRGHLSDEWPKNTVWLGGHWNRGLNRWMWDDGSHAEGLNWAEGQPSASEDQDHEPFLCMTLDGRVHDSEPDFDFGIVCERGLTHEDTVSARLLQGLEVLPPPSGGAAPSIWT